MQSDLICKNIKHLRLLHGETQEELGRILNVERNTISNYENGRTPDSVCIERIARHYKVSIDELMTTELQECMGLNPANIVDMDKMMDCYTAIIPFIDTEIDNISFMDGVKKINIILDTLRKDGVLSSSIIMEAYDCFVKAIEEDVEEAIVNLIWCIFFIWSQQYADFNRTLQLQKRLSEHRIEWKELIYEINKNIDSTVDKRHEFISNYDSILYDMISALKDRNQFRELGDYFLALRYIVGMIDTDYSDEINRIVGIEMMLSFVKMENEYALKYIEAVMSFE